MRSDPAHPETLKWRVQTGSPNAEAQVFWSKEKSKCQIAQPALLGVDRFQNTGAEIFQQGLKSWFCRLSIDVKNRFVAFRALYCCETDWPVKFSPISLLFM